MHDNLELYERALQLLAEQKLGVTHSEYLPMFGGCWTIVVTALPELRLVWDSRENWAVIQQKTEERWQDMPVWIDVWFRHTPDFITLQEAVSELSLLLRPA